MGHKVISVSLDKRNEDAPDVQEIFTRHGCIIQARLGLHEVKGCSGQGLILLVAQGEDNELEALTGELSSLPRIHVNMMVI